MGKDIKKSLTIVIPTWNRARYLEKNLELLDSYLKRGLDFKILVCNNGSTDSTQEVLKKYRNHSRVCIIDHPENIKFDRNVASGYMNFDTDFVFCLGDSKTLSYESLKKMIKTINEGDIDALVIKAAPTISYPEKYYTEINDLLSELGWILTNISSCVIPKNFICLERCERYYDSQFIHYGVFVDALCAQERIRVKYDPTIEKEMISFQDEKQPHGWSSNVVNIWGGIWFAFIMSLPWKVRLDTKYKVISVVNRNDKYLAPKKFILAKINGDKNFINDYKRNRRIMPFVSTTPLLVYDIISLFPSFCYQWMRPLLRLSSKYREKVI